MAGPPLPSREGLIGDVADEVLQEAVLAVLGRARVGLKRDDFLANQGVEQRIEFCLRELGERGERGARERLPEYRSILEQPALRRRETIQAGGDQRMQRLWHLERLDCADRPVDGTLLDERAAVEQHPDRLDGVERDAFGAGEYLLAQRLRQARNEAGQQLLHRLLRERLEIERREVAVARAPGRPALEQLGPSERDHAQRRVARPLEEVLHEVEQ